MNEIPTLIIGGGGHAKVLIASLKNLKVQIIGIVDPQLKIGDKVLGQEVLGGDEVLEQYDPKRVFLVNGLGSVGDNRKRHKLFVDLKNKGFLFRSVIDPSALISEDVTLGEGVQLMCRSIIQPGTTIGDNSIINTGAQVDHDCRIDSSCHIAPGVVVSGCVHLGVGVHVGTGASIIQGIKVGSGSLIGAGAVVIRDVAEKTLLTGKGYISRPLRRIDE